MRKHTVPYLITYTYTDDNLGLVRLNAVMQPTSFYNATDYTLYYIQDGHHISNPLIVKIYGRTFESQAADEYMAPADILGLPQDVLEDDYPLHAVNANLNLKPDIPKGSDTSRNMMDTGTDVRDESYHTRASQLSARYPQLEEKESKCLEDRGNLLDCYKIEDETAKCSEPLSIYSKCVRRQSFIPMTVA